VTTYSGLDMNHTTIFNEIGKILLDAVNAKLAKKLQRLQTLSLEQACPDQHNVIMDIISSHSYDARITLRLALLRRSRTKKETQPDSRCLARIGLGMQCSRSHLESSDYCRSHQVSRPYGRIDRPESDHATRVRRGKADTHQIADLDMDKYVQAILINIDSNSYYMDQNGILYYTENNEIAGIVTDEVEWYKVHA
jgi:hypothetical protein